MSEERKHYSPSDGDNSGLLNRCTESEIMSLIDVSDSGREITNLEWEKKLLEEQLKVSRIETEKAKLEADKARTEAANIGLQAELKMMKFQMEQLKVGVGKGESTNFSQLRQQIIDLETEVAKQNGQLRENFKTAVKELKKENALLAAKFAHKNEVANTVKAKSRNEPLVQFPDNRWQLTSQWRIGANGLTARNYDSDYKNTQQFRDRWVNLYAEYSLQKSADLPAGYFEVLIKEMSAHPSHKDYPHMTSIMEIGMSGRDIPADCTVGQRAFAIDDYGRFWVLGHKLDAQEREGFGEGDTIGCGHRISCVGRRHIFFTKNGQLMGSPFLLGADERNNLFPTITAHMSGNVTVDANFGTDLAKTPFKFDLAKLME